MFLIDLYMKEVSDNIKIDNIYKQNFFPSYDKLVKLVQEKYDDISRRQIRQFLDNQKVYQITKRQLKSNRQGHITADFPNERWQADLFAFSQPDDNDGFKYILCCIDVFTRKARYVPMKNKDTDACISAFKELFEKYNIKPYIINSDSEGGLISKKFQDYILKEKVVHSTVSNNDHKALGIIDRFALTLRTILTKYLYHKQSKRWIDVIGDIINHYNNTNHSGIMNIKPNDADKEGNKERIKEMMDRYQIDNRMVSDLNVGDKVRKRIMRRKLLLKGSGLQFSENVFEVVKTVGDTVFLNDDTKYRRDDLLLVERKD
jgi:hypothetical protein